MSEPVPFEAYEGGVYLHGTKADLDIGDLLVPGRESNFEAGRVMTYVCFTAMLAGLDALQESGRAQIED